MNPSIGWAVRIGAFALAYFVGGLAYFVLLWETEHVPPLWPPAGLLLAVLLRSPERHWPIWLAAALPPMIAACMIGGYGFLTALGSYVADIVTALAGAYMVRRVMGPETRLESLRDLAALVLLGAVLAPLPGAAIGSAVLYFGAQVPLSGSFFYWWAAVATSVILISPAVMSWRGGWLRGRLAESRGVELLLLLFSCVAVPTAALLYLHWSFAFLAIPVLTWAAIRFSTFEAAGSNLLISAVSIILVYYGYGRVEGLEVSFNDRILSLQIFLSFLALSPSLSVALAMTEARRRDQALAAGEARWRSLMDHTPTTIVVFDRDGRYIAANRCFVDWFGIEESDVLGKVPGDFFSPEVARLATKDCSQVLSDKVSHNQEYDVAFEDGEMHKLLVTWFPVPDEKGEIVAVGAITADITDLRRTRELLAQAQRLEAVGQLTGGVAHDFNNLLAVIIGNLELALDQTPAEATTAHQMRAAFGAAERGEQLVRQLLAFSRRQALRPEVIDLNETLRSLQPLLRRTLGEQIEIEVVQSAGLWRSELDPAQVESAILNLAINARDAMPRGGRLTIETANAHLDESYAAEQIEAPQPGQYAMVAVSDTGVGMTEEQCNRAFEPFFTTKPVGKGSGLGLAMVQGFVRQSGGHVSIYSEPNHGTTVKLYLPRSLAPDTRPSSQTSGSARATPGGRHENLLVLEDDERVRNLLRDMLTEMGYRVRAAQNGPEALAMIEADSNIDLLVSDVVLSGPLSGPETATQAATLCPGLRVLFTSGYTANGIVHHGRLDPGVDLLQKPFRKAELARAVRRALDTAPNETPPGSD